MKQIELEPGAVGRSPPRKDGADKVTGRARYLDDLTFPGQLWGRTVRSHVAHGRIRGIAWDPRFDWSDVVRVTAADIPGENIVQDRKSTRLNSSHQIISYAVFCFKKQYLFTDS